MVAPSIVPKTPTLKFTPIMSWSGSIKTSTICGYNCNLYEVHGIKYTMAYRSLGTRKDTESINNSIGDDLQRPFSEYNNSNYYLLYKNEILIMKEKDFVPTIFLTREFPRNLQNFLPIFELLFPKEFSKIKHVVEQEFPLNQFPLKIEIPVFPLVTGIATFNMYNETAPIDSTMFSVPNDYTLTKL